MFRVDVNLTLDLLDLLVLPDRPGQKELEAKVSVMCQSMSLVAEQQHRESGLEPTMWWSPGAIHERILCYLQR